MLRFARNDGFYTTTVFDPNGAPAARFDFVPDVPGSLAGVENETLANGTQIRRVFDEYENLVSERTISNGTQRNRFFMRRMNKAHSTNEAQRPSCVPKKRMAA